MLSNSGMSANGLTAFFISSMPYISTAKPTRIPPISRRRVCLDAMISTIPTSAMSGEKDSGLSSSIKKLSLSMPAKLRIHAVRVVPIFEPIITPTVCPSCMMPELTSPTSMTVSADEDWIAMVMPAPSAKLLNGLEVIRLSRTSSFPPAIFSRPEDITCIPYRKNANPPNSVKREKISITAPQSSFLHSLLYRTFRKKGRGFMLNLR